MSFIYKTTINNEWMNYYLFTMNSRLNWVKFKNTLTLFVILFSLLLSATAHSANWSNYLEKEKQFTETQFYKNTFHAKRRTIILINSNQGLSDPTVQSQLISEVRYNNIHFISNLNILLTLVIISMLSFWNHWIVIYKLQLFKLHIWFWI